MIRANIPIGVRWINAIDVVCPFKILDRFVGAHRTHLFLPNRVRPQRLSGFTTVNIFQARICFITDDIIFPRPVSDTGLNHPHIPQRGGLIIKSSFFYGHRLRVR